MEELLVYLTGELAVLRVVNIARVLNDYIQPKKLTFWHNFCVAFIAFVIFTFIYHLSSLVSLSQMHVQDQASI